jgi:hypothetical protein
LKTIVLTISAFLVGSSASAQTSLLGDLKAERSKFGTPMSKAETALLLNNVALRNPGWGLLSKNSGNICPLPNGVTISCDYLVHQPSQKMFDVLKDVEGAGTPVWGSAHDIPEDREFIAPIGGTPQPPAPQPPDNSDTIARLQQQVEQLIQHLDIINTAIDSIRQQATETQSRLQVVETALTARPIPMACRAGLFGLPVRCEFEYQ